MLLLYYGRLKSNVNLIVCTSSFGCAVEVIYLVLYIVYAPKRDKVFTVKGIILFNLGGYCLIMVVTNLLTQRSKRVIAMGWICAVYSVAVYASPLSIMRHVIRTKSVEYMPFPPSFFLTLCATMWFFYGLLIQDFFVALPNVLGFLLGITQMIIYVKYKNANKGVEITEQMQKEDMESSVGDIKPSFADHEQIKKITIVIAEKKVESDEIKA
ncbi:Nodulin MtN3 family protein isoform 2 [Hibiscus syriacus]|uniref:Nodulin MtN3 family protein isoform 2 n=2 Tax=Hibiscus syriacus TaxID=106335 RepID=A0A6A3CHD8_HIBSY|nr:Nodulin MtN3 family protein isoform 2 [Hibiscus syriacus]